MHSQKDTAADPTRSAAVDFLLAISSTTVIETHGDTDVTTHLRDSRPGKQLSHGWCRMCSPLLHVVGHSNHAAGSVRPDCHVRVLSFQLHPGFICFFISNLLPVPIRCSDCQVLSLQCAGAVPDHVQPRHDKEKNSWTFW